MYDVKKKLHTSSSMTLFQLFERYFHFGSFNFDSLPFLIFEQYLQRKLLVYYLPKFCRLSQIYSQSVKGQRTRAIPSSGNCWRDIILSSLPLGSWTVSSMSGL